MSYDGVLDFYLSRIKASRQYGLYQGQILLNMVERAALEDSMVTIEEYSDIIKQCQIARIQLLEDDFNEGWQ